MNLEKKKIMLLSGLKNLEKKNIMLLSGLNVLDVIKYSVTSK